MMDDDLKLLKSEIEMHLVKIADTLPEILKSVDKRIKALGTQSNVTVHENKTIEMEKVIAELCNSLEPVYSASPEGRAYLSKCRSLLASENIDIQPEYIRTLNGILKILQDDYLLEDDRPYPKEPITYRFNEAMARGAVKFTHNGTEYTVTECVKGVIAAISDDNKRISGNPFQYMDFHS